MAIHRCENCERQYDGDEENTYEMVNPSGDTKSVCDDCSGAMLEEGWHDISFPEDRHETFLEAANPVKDHSQ